MTPDISVLKAGSVSAVRGCTERGWEWITDHVKWEPWQMHGTQIVIDHRSLDAIVRGALDAGLEIGVDVAESIDG